MFALLVVLLVKFIITECYIWYGRTHWSDEFRQELINMCTQSTSTKYLKFCECIVTKIEKRGIIQTHYNILKDSKDESTSMVITRIQTYFKSNEGKSDASHCLDKQNSM